MNRPTPFLLIILDGFGISLDAHGNPIAEAHTPNIAELERFFPFTVLQASGTAVGLPWGVAGNSEVGHLTIGAGRHILHHLPRIIRAIHDGSFMQNPAFLKAIEHVHAHESRLHIIGLVSSGTVHSYFDHLLALLELTKAREVQKTSLHVITDGKDTPPSEGASYLTALEERLRREYPHVSIATVIGRTYAMDREQRWDRIETYTRLLTQGVGATSASIREYLEAQYREGLTDESIPPTVILSDGETRGKLVAENDGVIFLNFREDSMRELASVFADPNFDRFPTTIPDNLYISTMTEYRQGLAAHAAFPLEDIAWPLAQTLSAAGLTHLHIAEVPKYAHVTYFLNGGREEPFPNETRLLIPSVRVERPDDVPTMRAYAIASHVIAYMHQRDVIIANFANADIIGHTGNFRASITAVEALDAAVGKLIAAVSKGNAAMLITADHGNIELKTDRLSGERITRHSVNPVPLFLVGNAWRRAFPRNEEEITAAKKNVAGMLTDVAPTALELLGISQPPEMTGTSLLQKLIS